MAQISGSYPNHGSQVDNLWREHCELKRLVRTIVKGIDDSKFAQDENCNVPVGWYCALNQVRKMVEQ
jgi:hypothetical protein